MCLARINRTITSHMYLSGMCLCADLRTDLKKGMFLKEIGLNVQNMLDYSRF